MKSGIVNLIPYLTIELLMPFSWLLFRFNLCQFIQHARVYFQHEMKKEKPSARTLTSEIMQPWSPYDLTSDWDNQILGV